MKNNSLLLPPLALVAALVCLPTSGAEHGGIPGWAKPRLQRLLRGARSAAAHGGGRGSRVVEVTVAQNGSGQYRTIAAALAAAPKGKKKAYTIRIGEGTYIEQLNITRHDVTLFGEGVGKTVITGNRGSLKHDDMPSSATVTASGHGFMARDLTIQNTAGPEGNQSLALRSSSNHTVVYRCELESFQDTLFAENGLQLYLDSEISGTVDFVFGNAKAVFQRCHLLVRRGREGAHNIVTAQGRDKPGDDTGFSFQNCRVMAKPSENLTGVETFLGRPWKNHSHVIFMQSFLDGIVHPRGWVEWRKEKHVLETTMTVSYMEFNNTGPGSNTSRRVHWKGFSVVDANKAEDYTVDRFIHGTDWLPNGLNYKPGLY
uniref:Pectinesterase n=1 Tax=Oryza punctata TaxID=4537 RepID=A0A0E0MGG7_ORYPU